jgi:O-antigen ligase
VLPSALRLALGIWLTRSVGLAVIGPELSWLCAGVAATIAAVTLWRPAWGLVVTTAIVPAGALLAIAPARAAELFAWAFLGAWLLRLWRPLSVEPWPTPISIPAALFGGALITSWLSLVVSGAAGVPWTALPQLLFQSIPRDYLIYSASEPETWTLLQSLTGLGLFVAAVGVTRDEPRCIRRLALALVGSMTVLAVATPIDVARQWAATGHADWFLTRFTQFGERFSFHITDVNAAGSLYVLAGGISAAYVTWAAGQRVRWGAVFVLLTPAIWLSGSRSAYLGIIGTFAFVAVARSRWTMRRGPALLSVMLLLAVVLSVVTMVDRGPGTGGGVRQSASLRSQFLQTSVRMFASSPVFGVGIGRYFDRSAEYMTPALRDLYGNENAHNYFAQQFSEVGLVGGVPFVWLIAATARAGWHRIRQSHSSVAVLALLAGTGGYVLTCVTGHPLLVPEAALPFWAAFGAVAGTSIQTPAVVSRALALVAGVTMAAGVGQALLTYGRVNEPPTEYGFHDLETDEDGTAFRWMTRHSVTYIPDGNGLLRLRLRAPERPMPRPLVIETSIAGHVADRREVMPGDWTTVDIPVRTTGTPFRRVDFRTNQVWTEEVRLGQRAARRPIAVMVEDISWIPLR